MTVFVSVETDPGTAGLRTMDIELALAVAARRGVHLVTAFPCSENPSLMIFLVAGEASEDMTSAQLPPVPPAVAAAVADTIRSSNLGTRTLAIITGVFGGPLARPEMLLVPAGDMRRSMNEVWIEDGSIPPEALAVLLFLSSLPPEILEVPMYQVMLATGRYHPANPGGAE